MLDFRFATIRSATICAVNPRRAVLELLELADGSSTPAYDLVHLNATG